MNGEELIVNGVKIAATGGKPGKTVTLPSGAKAEIRSGKGCDWARAQRAAASDGQPELTMALIAELCTVGGKRVVYEEVREMPLADVLALARELLDENFSFPPPPVSRNSWNSDSQPEN